MIGKYQLGTEMAERAEMTSAPINSLPQDVRATYWNLTLTQPPSWKVEGTHNGDPRVGKLIF